MREIRSYVAFCIICRYDVNRMLVIYKSMLVRAVALSTLFGVFFFFSSRRRHTRLVSDWSSDVCSSDLKRRIEPQNQPIAAPVFQANLAHDSRAARKVAVKAFVLTGFVQRDTFSDEPRVIISWFGIRCAGTWQCVTRANRVVRDHRSISAHLGV